MSETEPRSPKILIADDDPQILNFVKLILESEGYTAVTARDGKEAYKHLHSGETFAAAIFDIVMPHIEGRDLLRYMKTEKRLMKIPVIITTGDPNPRLSAESMSSGAASFLPKPFTELQIKTMLRMLLSQTAANQ